MWGICANGTEAVGCGLPETFRNCADISITTSTLGLPPAFVSSIFQNPFALSFKTALPNSVQPLVIRFGILQKFTKCSYMCIEMYTMVKL